MNIEHNKLRYIGTAHVRNVSRDVCRGRGNSQLSKSCEGTPLSAVSISCLMTDCFSLVVWLCLVTHHFNPPVRAYHLVAIHLFLVPSFFSCDRPLIACRPKLLSCDRSTLPSCLILSPDGFFLNSCPNFVSCGGSFSLAFYLGKFFFHQLLEFLFTL